MIGKNVVIAEGTKLGKNVIVGDNAVIGKSPVRAKRSATTVERELPPAEIGDNVIIGAGAVVTKDVFKLDANADGDAATSFGVGAIYDLPGPLRLLASGGPTVVDHGPTTFHVFVALGFDL